MFDFNYNPIGKTLAEVAKETKPDHYNGYSVFELVDQKDIKYGKHVASSYSVQAILEKYPEYSDYVVKKTNDFYGTTVLRVMKKRKFDFNYNPIDKTLAEVAKETKPDHYNGYSVFVLENPKDTTGGKEIATSYSVQAILEKYPEYSDYVVKKTNDFYGTTVLRVMRKQNKSRLTTDNPTNNTQQMLNYAYDKDGRVFLRYGSGEEDIDLCDYIAQEATTNHCHPSPEDVLEGACLDCDCPLAILHVVATQAAELRARLKEYEDCEERQSPKTPNNVSLTDYKFSYDCPSCGTNHTNEYCGTISKLPYCSICGQKLSWESETND